MIRLKQSMGNVIKCKIDDEEMISKYECSVLEDNRLNGLLNIQVDKASTIVYSDDVKKKLADVLSGSLDEDRVNDYLCQIARVILDVKKMGLNPEKLILNPEWVYLTKDERVLKFIYCPVNGMSCRFDGILFMKDVLLQAPLSKGARDSWKQWLENVTKTGITDQAVANVEKMNKRTSNTYNESKNSSIGFGASSSPASVYDDDGEPMTGVSDEDVWNPVQHDVDDEPMTGVEDSGFSWSDSSFNGPGYDNFGGDSFGNTGFGGNDFGGNMYSNNTSNGDYDDDGEAPTGVEDFHGYSSSMPAEPMVSQPYLVRVSTGERAVINGDNFKLGRSEQRADFCIRNNSGISNVHATIVLKNGQYFLKDNYSTNGTYVDGNRISDSSTPVLLRNGSVIQLYNEEIVFNC